MGVTLFVAPCDVLISHEVRQDLKIHSTGHPVTPWGPIGLHVDPNGLFADTGGFGKGEQHRSREERVFPVVYLLSSR